MKIFSCLLILFSFYSTISVAVDREALIKGRKFPDEFEIAIPVTQSRIISEERDIECTQICTNTVEPSLRASTRDSVFDDGRSKSISNKTQVKLKFGAKKELGSKSNKMKRKKHKNVLKSSKKSSATPSLEKPFSLPTINSKMPEPISEEVILAGPKRLSESINISDPSKTQFEIKSNNGFASSIFDGIKNIEQSLDDHLGIQLPTTLFNGNSKASFIGGLANKLAGRDEDERSLKKEDSLGRHVESRKDMIDGAGKTNLQLTMEIVKILLEINNCSGDPSIWPELLMKVRDDLLRNQSEQKEIGALQEELSS